MIYLFAVVFDSTRQTQQVKWVKLSHSVSFSYRDPYNKHLSDFVSVRSFHNSRQLLARFIFSPWKVPISCKTNHSNSVMDSMGDLYGIFRKLEDVPSAINVTCETNLREKAWKLLPLSTNPQTNFDFKSIEVTVDEFVNAEFGIEECKFKKTPIITEGPLPSKIIIDKNWVNMKRSYDYENEKERFDSIILFSYFDRKGQQISSFAVSAKKHM